MNLNELSAYVEAQYRRIVTPSTREWPRKIGLAFPQSLSSGVNQYQLESARNRQIVGVAGAAAIPAQRSGMVVARLPHGVVTVEVSTDHDTTRMPVSFNNALLAEWVEVEARRRFTATKVHPPDVGGELRVCEHVALWQPGSRDATGSVQFSLVSPHSCGDLIGGVADGLLQMVTRREQPSRDVVCDLDSEYGVPALALMGLILVLRMVVLTYDFDPSS